MIVQIRLEANKNDMANFIKQIMNYECLEEHDGCEGCKFMSYSINEKPCRLCKQSYFDKYVKETKRNE